MDENSWHVNLLAYIARIIVRLTVRDSELLYRYAQLKDANENGLLTEQDYYYYRGVWLEIRRRKYLYLFGEYEDHNEP